MTLALLMRVDLILTVFAVDGAKEVSVLPLMEYIFTTE